ncbi:MAG: hypothetical protein GXC73_14150 [Chitinophagaceae bacterium]|nr:hypothetical protein [Chitinophagaceae bacterium]
MNRNVTHYLAKDQIRICHSNKVCLEARGRNAEVITTAVAVLLFASAIYYLSKAS